MADNTQLKTIETGLSTQETQTLIETFEPFMVQARNWEAKALAIQVTSADQTDDIKAAREARLALKNIRVEAEKTRKNLKEDSLRRGKAIDGFANIIKGVIAPIEQHLAEQENYIERMQAEVVARITAEREAALAPFVEDTSTYQLAGMNDETFALILDGAKEKHAQRIAAEKQAAEEAALKAQAEAEERERIRKENEALKAQAAAREAELAAERVKAENERKKAEDERKAREEAEAAKIKAEKEAEAARIKAEEEAEAARLQAEREAEISRLEAEAAARIATPTEEVHVFHVTTSGDPSVGIQPETIKITAEGLNIHLANPERLDQFLEGLRLLFCEFLDDSAFVYTEAQLEESEAALG